MCSLQKETVKEVPIEKLSVEQLNYVGQQIEKEIKNYSQYYSSLRAVNNKYLDNKEYIKQLKDYKDKEILVTIDKAIDSSPELRSKKELINDFINDVNSIEDVITEWNKYVSEQREKELNQMIKDERLKPDETRKFIETSFRYGEVRTAGTDINRIMPAMSRFGGGNRTERKQTIIDKLIKFFEKYFGIGDSPRFTE